MISAPRFHSSACTAWLATLALAFALVLSDTRTAAAQDLYDTSVLRTVHLQFHDAGWEALLRANYNTDTYILADLTFEGVTYPDVGVRIRGNTSYTMLPSGSQKFSLKLKLDHEHENQELWGYKTLNLNNGFMDPTFTREVVYNNYVAQFIPNMRANHVVVSLNGQNWGVYINVQQGNKRMLRDYFEDADGLRMECSNNPNGPGLAYNGPTASGYTAYELDDDGGLTDPWSTFIAVTYALSNTANMTTNWPQVDQVFAIDPSIWSVVLENLLTDDDSYVNKGCDFNTYRDPLDGRLHLIQRDANESFSVYNWSPTRNFTAAGKPVLSRVLAVPELRQRYMAHYRTVLRDLDWNYFGPKFTALRGLIDAAVQADPKKLYTYANFTTNFASTVNLGGGGGPGGGSSRIGLQEFVTQRASYLAQASNAELNAVGPAISAVAASDDAPAPSDAVHITAAVAAAGSAGIAKVELFYRADRSGTYQRTAMRDDGASGDGAAGDGVYGAPLPVSASGGQSVDYYVMATSTNAYGSVSFVPEYSELRPLRLTYALDAGSGLRITEWMYSGGGGEFVEITNLGEAVIDLSGWSLDDANATPGVFPLTALGSLAAGEAAVITESDAAAFRAAWGLPATAKVLGGLGAGGVGNNYGRADQIHLYDAGGALVDRLAYDDQTLGGPRTQNASGQPASCEAIGADDVTGWVLSAAGDGFGSWAADSGDVGTPGVFPESLCAAGGGEGVFSDGFEAVPPVRPQPD